MEKLVNNTGLESILVDIFKFLNLSSLRQCLLVSKSWRQLILRRKVLWSNAISIYRREMLEKIEGSTVTLILDKPTSKWYGIGKDSFCEMSLKFNICFHDWRNVFQFFQIQSCPRIIVKFLALMDDYLENLQSKSWLHPLNFAIKTGKLSYVKLLHQPCLLMNFQEERIFQSLKLKETALYVACLEEQVAIIDYLLNTAKTLKIKINVTNLLKIAHVKGWVKTHNVLKQWQQRGQKRKRSPIEIIHID